MSIFDNLGNLLKQATSGGAPEADVHAAYDQVSQAVPQGTLADGLTHAFQSDQTPPFEQMVANLFSHSTPEQKAGILNQLLASLGPAGVAQLQAATGGVAGTISPQQAQQVTPATVQAVAQQAAQKNPSIMEQAAGFYSQHPTLVKSIGVTALAMLMSRISSARRG